MQSRRGCFVPATARAMRHHRFFEEPPRLTLADVAEMTGAVLVQSERALVPITGLAALDEAGPSHLTFLQSSKFVPQLATCHAAACLVSHRMEEIYRISDRVAILRDGQHVATEAVADMARDRAVQLMVGRALDRMYPEVAVTPGAEVLRVSGLSRDGAFENVSFTVRAGEILGFAGLVGSGRTEIARVLFGIDRATSGSIQLDGRPVSFASPSEAMAHGLAYLSEDRIGQSLIMDFAILANASLAVIDQATRGGFVSPRRELDHVKAHLDRLRLRFRSYDQPVKTLSGGNQQKVVVSKWLATRPRLLILDEPTQGVDVQTKAEVHAVIADLARRFTVLIVCR